MYNLPLIDSKDLKRSITVYKDTVYKDAFKAGVCVSGLVRFASSGEEIGDFTIPAEKKGITCRL